ncbi:MAG: hypothetical protein DME91_01630 [Verrucomicrobia bacterium]|nr:MAG: hypothetical protein DME91_01630 [Verrucomicrobiota bacterium]
MEKNYSAVPKTALAPIDQLKQYALPTMKKYICILASAALLAACEQKTETTEPAASPTATTPAATAPATSPAETTTTTSPAGTTESPVESPTP